MAPVRMMFERWKRTSLGMRSPGMKFPLRTLFWVALVFAFLMATLPHPPAIPGAPSDKLQHIAAFATLAVLGAWAYPGTSKIRLAIGLALFGAAIELVQMTPALHRDAEWMDLVADICAVLLALLAASVMMEMRRRARR